MPGSYRIAIVAAVDVEKASARVRFPDLDEMLSFWLPVLQTRTRGDTMYWLPEEGEQVVVMMDPWMESGVILGCIYSTVDVPPESGGDVRQVKFKDGTSITYDRSAHSLVIDVAGATSAEIRVNSSGTVRVTSAGDMQLIAGADLTLQANGALHLIGAPIHFNQG